MNRFGTKKQKTTTTRTTSAAHQNYKRAPKRIERQCLNTELETLCSGSSNKNYVYIDVFT